MTFLLALAYLVAAALVVLVGYLAIRAVSGALSGRQRKWTERSEADRRRRRVRIQKERRKSPRREDDIAQQFLSRVGDQ